MSVKTLFQNAYTEEEILVWISQLVGANHPLCDIEYHHQGQLLSFLRSIGYNYASGMMFVALQTDGNPPDINNTSVLDCTELITTLRDGYVLATIDRRYRHSCVLQLSAELDQGWVRDRLNVQLVTRLQQELLTSWKAIKLSQVVVVGSAIVCCDIFLVTLWQGC